MRVFSQKNAYLFPEIPREGSITHKTHMGRDLDGIHPTGEGDTNVYWVKTVKGFHLIWRV